ncbi:antibiotic biosynthesis monooxygenase family protein [Bacillus sp. PS06]|uniref:antibiotic biosynthesis monooxygenase family protein n=1 Tax=Bacillus sp. PS06 TaxID=2764176 RepID=UPI001781EDCB|nr:antibiotic biosynthesis monooxygenase [Bacillus sp. PS06]MBD8070157.1 antibiotic biosynthesis monooxygenase [Bacillus sp. PS06]
MFIVHSTFELPNENKIDEVIAIYQNRSRLVDQSEGFLDFKLLQNSKRLTSITVQLTWAKKEHYLAWVRSESFKVIHALEKKYPDQDLASIIPKVDQFEVVAT